MSKSLVKYFSKFLTVIFGLAISSCNGISSDTAYTGKDNHSKPSVEMNLTEFTNRWYEEARITDTDHEKELLEWLNQQTPDDWHAIISNWNYDSGSAALKWIVSHPDCDMGTAIQLFLTDVDWLAYEKSDLQPYNHDAFDTIHIARKRLLDESFINKELIPQVTYSKDDLNQSYPSIIRSYVGSRQAQSDYMSEDGSIYLTPTAFAKNIGIDYSAILNRK